MQTNGKLLSCRFWKCPQWRDRQHWEHDKIGPCTCLFNAKCDKHTGRYILAQWRYQISFGAGQKAVIRYALSFLPGLLAGDSWQRLQLCDHQQGYGLWQYCKVLERIRISEHIPERVTAGKRSRTKKTVQTAAQQKNKTVQSKKSDAKREMQVRSFFGQHFKKKIYVERKEDIIKTILNAGTKQEVNNGLMKLYTDGTVVSHIHKTVQPLIGDLPGKWGRNLKDRVESLMDWVRFVPPSGHSVAATDSALISRFLFNHYEINTNNHSLKEPDAEKPHVRRVWGAEGVIPSSTRPRL